MKFRILDLYCGAGGAGEGYSRAGFQVVGVDIKAQPRNPHEFHQGDALEFLEKHGHEFDAIHTSPPCQRHSVMTKGRWKDRLKKHRDMIPATRKLLKKIGKPYIIENVYGAKSELFDPIMLCGSMFGLETRFGSQLRRHRLFETSFPISYVPECNHKKGSVIGVYGGGQHPGRRYHRGEAGELVTQRKRIPAVITVTGNSGGSSNRDGIAMFGTQDRRDAMGIQWMSGKELSQAIPPAYTEFISKYLLAHLAEVANG